MTAENTTAPPAPQAGDAGERRRTRRLLLVAFFAAVAVRAAAAQLAGSAQPQEVRYITIARGIISGQGYHGLDNRFPDIIQPPFYPVLLAGALLLPGPDLAIARGVSILMGALLVFPCAAIARRLFDEKAARRTALLIAPYPLLAHMSSAAITESSFAILVTCGALALWKGLDRPDARGRALHVVASSLLLGMSYLTRPEGLTYVAIAVLVIVCDQLRVERSRRSLARGVRLAALAGGSFVLFALPYLFWVHFQTGRWLMAPKAVLVQVHQTLRQEGQRENWKEPYDSLLFMEHVKFGLNGDATAIRAHEAFNAVNVGLTDGFLVSDEGDVSLIDPTMATRMISRNLQEMYLETIKYGFVMPSILLMMLGIGIISRPWTGAHLRSSLIVMAFFAGSFSFLLTHVQSRFLYVAIAFLMPWMAEGWSRTEAWAVASLGRGRAARAVPVERAVKLGLGVLVLGLTVVHLVPAIRQTSRLWGEHREMGLWLHDQDGPGRKVMAASPILAYYAGADFEVLPYADYDRMLAYARSKRVDYLVIDRAEIPTFRPQLTSLLIPDRPHPGLKLVRGQHEGTPHAIFLYSVTPSNETAQ